MTLSGVYYLPFTLPLSPYGSRGFALHVADGSEIIARHIGGRHLTIFVGNRGQERYGACLRRLEQSRLADSYLPILDTSYVDGAGVRYRQESFVGRAPGTKSLVSFVHVTADARGSSTGAVVRFVASSRVLRVAGDRLISGAATVLVFSHGGRFDGSAVEYRVPPGRLVQVYAAWINQPGPVSGLTAGEHSYAVARKAVSRFWRAELARGATFVVPEARVVDAERALVVQELSMTWRYSVGNTYEELSFAEALDVAGVMAEYGYEDIAKAILRFTLRRLPERFSSRRAGERLVAGALYYRLSHDSGYVREQTPELASAVVRLGREIDRPGGSTGLLNREAALDRHRHQGLRPARPNRRLGRPAGHGQGMGADGSCRAWPPTADHSPRNSGQRSARPWPSQSSSSRTEPCSCRSRSSTASAHSSD